VPGHGPHRTTDVGRAIRRSATRSGPGEAADIRTSSPCCGRTS